MSDVTRFGVSIEQTLLHSFDRLIGRKGYHNRSEAIRDLIRDSLVQEEWESARRPLARIAIVYDHHTRQLSKVLTDLQHNFFKFIISTIHIHLDAHHCIGSPDRQGE